MIKKEIAPGKKSSTGICHANRAVAPSREITQRSNRTLARVGKAHLHPRGEFSFYTTSHEEIPLDMFLKIQ